MTGVASESGLLVAVRVSVVDSAREPRPAVLIVHHVTRRERLLLALERLGIVWSFAVLAVAVPVLHLVLVPALLLAGPLAAVVATWRDVRVVTGQALACPKCRGKIVVDDERMGWPVRLDCGACGAALRATADAWRR